MPIFKQFQDKIIGRDDLGWCIDIEIRISEGKHHQIRRIASRGNFLCSVVSKNLYRLHTSLGLDSE